MKRIISVSLIIMIFVGCMAFSASASVYSGSGIRLELPEDAVINNMRAESTNSSRSWTTEDNNFSVDVLVKTNYDKGSYVNFSEDDIRDVFYDYTAEHDGSISLESGRNIIVNGFEGLRMDIVYEYDDETTLHTVCAFSTEDKVYTIYFYVNDEKYTDYVDQIVNTITIEGKPYNDIGKDILGSMFYVIAVVFVVGAIVYISRKRTSKSSKKSIGFTDETEYEDIGISYGTTGVSGGKVNNSSRDKTSNSFEKF